LSGEVLTEGMCQSSVDKVRASIEEYQTSGHIGDEGHFFHEFYNLLAVCHTVVCDKDPKTGEIQY